MFLKKLKLYFLIITLSAIIFLGYSFYQNYQFKTNNLDSKTLKEVDYKQRMLRSLAFKNFQIRDKIPVIISDKLPANLFGLAVLDEKQNIKIYLNKKRFKESHEYMINDVLPHEYAHALMFVLGDTTKNNGGHTKKWQNICKKLEGVKCDRFVNNHDIVVGKLDFLYK